MATIRIDLQKLQADGLIGADTARLIEAHAVPDTRFGLFVNLALIMGALAVALVPNATTGLALAILAVASAEGIRRLAPAPR